MKKYLSLSIIFFTCLMACENKAGIHKDPSQIPGKDSIDVKVSVVPQKQAGPARSSWAVGDVDKDQRPDSAFIEYEAGADIKPEKLCPNRNCEITIRFTHHIPDLVIQQSLGVYLEQSKDLNHDGANDLVIFSEWVEGYWQYISVWSLNKGAWLQLANTKAFLADDKDYKNRIVEKKGRFYLSGDAWNDSLGVVGRSVAVKIGK